MNVLHIDKLRKNMPKLKIDIASLEVKEGELAVILGMEKSGKSTLFKLLLDMIFADYGDISILGMNSSRDSVTIKQQLGVVLRRPGFIYSATLKQLKEMWRPFYDNWDEKAFNNYLSYFELTDNMIYGRIDNSAKKMFVVSLALAHHPRLLLMDEPFTQVDDFAKEHIAQILWQEQRERGLSVLLTTADPKEAARLGDTLHILHRGSLVISLPHTQLAEAAADLPWQNLPKRSRNEETACKIAQTEALLMHYTREEGERI